MRLLSTYPASSHCFLTKKAPTFIGGGFFAADSPARQAPRKALIKSRVNLGREEIVLIYSEMRSNSRSIGVVFGINEGDFSQHKTFMT